MSDSLTDEQIQLIEDSLRGDIIPVHDYPKINDAIAAALRDAKELRELKAKECEEGSFLQSALENRRLAKRWRTVERNAEEFRDDGDRKYWSFGVRALDPCHNLGQAVDRLGERGE